MDSEHHAWLRHVLEATARAADDVDAGGDPHHRQLHRDLVELRDRLSAELTELERDL